MKQKITIGQLVKFAGVTIKAVRHYHKLGLLEEPSRDSSGYRHYSAGHAITLVKIKTLADAGVPLSRIKELLGTAPNRFEEGIAEIDRCRKKRITRHNVYRTRKCSCVSWNKGEGMDSKLPDPMAGTADIHNGDVIYAIALGFWVLSVTGSTVLMGTLIASSTLPGLLTAPFAGVFVDRSNRKYIMIINDLIRGVSVILIGIAGFTGFLQIWMVFAAGIILSFTGAFFNPSVYSVIPDIVPKSKILKANSVFSMVSLGSNTVGNSAGGFLYQMLGAPLMFLLNGISYIFSGISIIFMKIPQIHKEKNQQNFFRNFKDGIQFIWNFKGLRYMVLMGAIISFFFGIVLVLLMPLFQKSASLGPVKYGIFMALFALGILLGMMLTSVFSIPPSRRINIFIISLFVTEIIFALISAFEIYGVMLVFILLVGFTNSFVNVL